jgi:biopolymer transport protein ExbD
MAQRNFNRYRGQAPMADMNVVPLVDVMLVLLVIFIVTAPLLTHAVKIDLPKASSSVNITKPEHIELGLREGGELFWNGEAVSLEALARHLAAAAARPVQPELHIRADRHVHYEKVAQVMALAAKAGLVRIGFVSEPVAGAARF